MTEMEELKRNTEKARAEQSFAAFVEWMKVVSERWDKGLDEAGKNLRWMYIVGILQVFTGLVLASPFSLLFFLLLWFLFFRQSKINEEIEYQKGLTVGAYKTLFLLGFADRDPEDEINKRMKRRRVIKVSLFRRFKELFERLGSKDKQEATI